MKPAHPPQALLSPHRLARFCKAAKLWLLRAAGWLLQAADPNAPLDHAVARAIRPFIWTMKRVVYALLLLNATAQPVAPPDTFSGRAAAAPRSPRTHHANRPRAKTRSKPSQDPRALIAALLMLLQNLEAHAKRLARRMRNGPPRRIGAFRLERRTPLLNVLSLLAPACADTS